MNETTRLNKYIAECGVCSRRDADKLILEGRVTVNGEQADMGYQVKGTESICVNGKPLGKKDSKVVYAYYKPVGITCTERDPHAEKIITKELKLPTRVTYAGRLDKDSEGLLLLTNDGDLINALMRGANKHEKEYTVTVDKEITGKVMESMERGVYLKDLDETTRPCKIQKIGKYTMRIILTQGLNRQIRRMCKSFGLEVRTLKRIRINQILLGDLKPGQYRELAEEEKNELYRTVQGQTGKNPVSRRRAKPGI